MHRRLLSCFLLIFLIDPLTVCAAEAEFRYPVGKYKGGELNYINGLPVLLVQGTPEEIGEQTAVLTVEAARPLMDLPKKMLQRRGVGFAWPFVVAAAKTLLKQSPKSHRLELEKIIDVGKIDRDSLLVGNCLLELRRIGGCATLFVDAKRSATGGPLLGRNFDLPPMGLLDKYSIVSIVRPKGKRAFAAIGYPGLVGVISGMNDAGLTIATLDVYSSKDGSSRFNLQGTPLTFCYRRLLEECATVDEAVKLMRSMKRTTWMNLAVCDKQEGVVFEITPDNVVVRRPEKSGERAGVLPCTNHFRSAKLATRIACRRYSRLQEIQRRRMFSIRHVAAAMHAVNQGKWTLQTMVFEPATLKLHLSIGAGPASARELKTLKLGPLLGPKVSVRLY